MAASMTPSRSSAIRSLPGGARCTLGRLRHAGDMSLLERDPLRLRPTARRTRRQASRESRRRSSSCTRARRLGEPAKPSGMTAVARRADEMRQRVAAEDDNRQQAQRHAARARHQKRHERQFRDVELESRTTRLKAWFGTAHLGELEWHDGRRHGPMADGLRRGMVAEQRAQRRPRRLQSRALRRVFGCGALRRGAPGSSRRPAADRKPAARNGTRCRTVASTSPGSQRPPENALMRCGLLAE